MQRITHPLAIHLLYQQTNRLHHHDCIAGFDGDDNIVELFPFEDAQKLHTALNNSFWCITVARHDAVGKRAVIDTDTNGRMMLLADTDKRHQALIDFLQFSRIFLIGIFQMFERTSRINIVAWIDAYLFGILGSHICYIRIKVNISYQRSIVAVFFQRGTDVFQVLGFAPSLCGQTHQFSTCINDAFGLCYRRFRIVCRGCRHRLYPYGVLSSHLDVSDAHNR